MLTVVRVTTARQALRCQDRTTVFGPRVMDHVAAVLRRLTAALLQQLAGSHQLYAQPDVRLQQLAEPGCGADRLILAAGVFCSNHNLAGNVVIT